jgi:hypothetical protein
VLADPETFLKKGNLLNYIQGVEIKMTEDRGRGVFATELLKKGDLIAVELPIAESLHNDPDNFLDRCLDLSELKGYQSLRLA